MPEEKKYVYICNKVLLSALKKNQFNISLSKLKVLLNDYVEGKTKVIRTGKKINRFFRFKVEKLASIDVDELVKTSQKEKGGGGDENY